MRQDPAAPVLSIVREQNALRPARRTRCVTLDCDRIRIGLKCLKGSGVEEGLKIIKFHNTRSARNPGFCVTFRKNQARTGITQDIRNGICGEFDIDRDRHNTRAHRAEESNYEFDTVDGENSNAIAGLQTSPSEPSRTSITRLVQLTKGD